MLKLAISNIKDPQLRDLFQRIQDEFGVNPFLASDWVVREVTFNAAITNFLYPHGLNIAPKDVILTNKTGSGVITVNYDLIDRTNLNFTATGPCVGRFLIARTGRDG